MWNTIDSLHKQTSLLNAVSWGWGWQGSDTDLDQICNCFGFKYCAWLILPGAIETTKRTRKWNLSFLRVFHRFQDKTISIKPNNQTSSVKCGKVFESKTITYLFDLGLKRWSIQIHSDPFSQPCLLRLGPHSCQFHQTHFFPKSFSPELLGRKIKQQKNWQTDDLTAHQLMKTSGCTRRGKAACL